jgi:hypothetical protein
MVHGWPRNVFSLLKLQKLISDASGVSMGAFVMVTHSAHIYSDDYALVEKILQENFERELGYSVRQHFEEDPRGNMTVGVEEIISRKTPKLLKKPKRGRSKKTEKSYEIFVRLYAPGGGLLLKEWHGKTAMEIYIDMTDWDWLVMPSHLIYIGTELQRAQFAIQSGKPELYSQDPAPNKGL